MGHFIPSGSCKTFFDYCWSFYNPDSGVFPIEGLTRQQMTDACDWVQNHEPEWGGGGTDDRHSALTVLLANNPQLPDPQPWSKEPPPDGLLP